MVGHQAIGRARVGISRPQGTTVPGRLPRRFVPRLAALVLAASNVLSGFNKFSSSLFPGSTGVGSLNSSCRQSNRLGKYLTAHGTECTPDRRPMEKFRGPCSSKLRKSAGGCPFV